MLKEAFDFLEENKEVAFATVRNGRPSIRTFQIMKIEGTTLYFATSSKKEIYSQLKENPAVEILSYKANIQVRMSGNVLFDVPEDVRKEIFVMNPILPDLYPSYDNLVYARMDVKFIEYYDLTPRPPRMEIYTL